MDKKEYRAKSGDTWKTLAEYYYSEANGAKSLASFNKMAETDALSVEKPIIMPDRLFYIQEITSETKKPVAKVAVLNRTEGGVTFYIQRDKKEVKVVGPDDLKDDEYPHWEDVKDKDGKPIIKKGKVWKKRIPGVRVYYKENNTPKTLGYASALQNCKGIGNSIGKNLYEILIKEHRPINLSERQRRIWAAIWKSEGGLSAINTYDSAFLSFGPIQKTMGVKDRKGELPASLLYIKEKNPGIYAETLGLYRLEPIEIDDDTGYCQIDNKPIKTAAEKEEYRKFKWSFRFIKSMDNSTFATLFLEHNLKRIETIEKLSFQKGSSTLKFYDIYKTELAHALILDTHINLPSLVLGNSKKKEDPIWLKAIKNVKSVENKINENKNNEITLDEEIELIKNIVLLRNSSKMSDPKLRAAFIIMCCKEIKGNENLIKKLGYNDNKALLSSAFIKTTCEKYFYNFLELSRS